jgi:hypothetical protein
VANAACPGETSASLIHASAPSNGCENSPQGNTGYRKLFPLHVRYGGSQLAYAVKYLRRHHNVRLVSLMIGANDLFRCQTTTPDKCTSPVEQNSVLATIAHNVRMIVSTVRRKGRYRGQLALVNYYSQNYANAFINGISAKLTQAMSGAARRSTSRSLTVMASSWPRPFIRAPIHAPRGC